MTITVVTYEVGFTDEAGYPTIFIDYAKSSRKTHLPNFFDHPSSDRLQSFLAKVL